MTRGRIGLIADTHDDAVSWDEIHPRTVEAFGGVDLILHCGDLTTTGVLDRLAEIAPVVAVRSAADPPAEPPRLVDGPHAVEVGDVTIGLVNALEGHDPGELFGRPVDVVVHRATHRASVDADGPILLVNPGRPTLSGEVSVGILETMGPAPRATIVAL